MKNNLYLKRIIEEDLLFRLNTIGAVLIVDPKWCGKTTTALQHAKSFLFLQDPEMQKQFLTTGSIAPEYLLDGAKPRLIDEWQLVPYLWDTIRFKIYQTQKKIYLF